MGIRVRDRGRTPTKDRPVGPLKDGVRVRHDHWHRTGLTLHRHYHSGLYQEGTAVCDRTSYRRSVSKLVIYNTLTNLVIVRRGNGPIVRVIFHTELGLPKYKRPNSLTLVPDWLRIYFRIVHVLTVSRLRKKRLNLRENDTRPFSRSRHVQLIQETGFRNDVSFVLTSVSLGVNTMPGVYFFRLSVVTGLGKKLSRVGSGVHIPGP